MSFLDEFENLAIFTEGEFSDVAVVISPTALSSEISGIFDESDDTMFDQYGSPSKGRRITFLVETIKTDGLHNGDRLTIKGKNYQITEINPTHDGKLTTLVLKDAS